jgi:hypothetical protein
LPCRAQAAACARLAQRLLGDTNGDLQAVVAAVERVRRVNSSWGCS